MARTTPILNRNNTYLLFTSVTPHSHFHSFTSLRLAKPSLSHSVSSSSSLSSSSSSSCHITRVTTVPVEYAPSAPDFDFHRELSRLKSLRSRLADCDSLRTKLRVIDGDSRVKRFFNSGSGGFSAALASLSLSSEELFLFKCLVAAGQEHVLGWGFGFDGGEVESARGSVKSALYPLVAMIENLDVNGEGSGMKIGALPLNDEDLKDLKKLLKNLGEIEQFYNCIGGIIGYQMTVLEILAQSRVEMQTTNWAKSIQEKMECQFLEIHVPSGLDLSQNAKYASQAALWGVQTRTGLVWLIPTQVNVSLPQCFLIVDGLYWRVL